MNFKCGLNLLNVSSFPDFRRSAKGAPARGAFYATRVPLRTLTPADFIATGM